jgi:hypothetical protein
MSAMNGDTSDPVTTVDTALRRNSGSPASRIPSTMLTAIRMIQARTSVPNTCQPCRRTSW